MNKNRYAKDFSTKGSCKCFTVKALLVDEGLSVHQNTGRLHRPAVCFNEGLKSNNFHNYVLTSVGTNNPSFEMPWKGTVKPKTIEHIWCICCTAGSVTTDTQTGVIHDSRWIVRILITNWRCETHSAINWLKYESAQFVFTITAFVSDIYTKREHTSYFNLQSYFVLNLTTVPLVWWCIPLYLGSLTHNRLRHHNHILKSKFQVKKSEEPRQPQVVNSMWLPSFHTEWKWCRLGATCSAFLCVPTAFAYLYMCSFCAVTQTNVQCGGTTDASISVFAANKYNATNSNGTLFFAPNSNLGGHRNTATTQVALVLLVNTQPPLPTRLSSKHFFLLLTADRI